MPGVKDALGLPGADGSAAVTTIARPVIDIAERTLLLTVVLQFMVGTGNC